MSNDKHEPAVKAFSAAMNKAGNNIDDRVEAAVMHFISQLRTLASEITEAADHAEANVKNITRGILGK